VVDLGSGGGFDCFLAAKQVGKTGQVIGVDMTPDKQEVYRDAFRILKPGGRLAISDIVALAPLPEDIQQNLALVSACVGGAATLDDTRAMLTQVGFENIKITPKDESRKIISQ
jgi:SAM-dependent methyltransferase